MHETTRENKEMTANDSSSDRFSLFKLSSIVYGTMTLIGLAIMFYGHKNLLASFTWPADQQEILRHAGIGLVSAALLLVFSYNFENWFRSYRELKSVIMRLLGGCSVPMAVYLAAISSFGEEILFRGAIQPFAGVFITSILFGLVHLGQDGRVSSWSIWAMIAGFILGSLYDWTGNLWPAIIAHFLVNAISILNLRRSYQRFLEEKTGQSGTAKSSSKV